MASCQKKIERTHAGGNVDGGVDGMLHKGEGFKPL
jgi:hypothetical protein